MKKVREFLKKIRLKINKCGSLNRSKKLKIKNPTIISNNCYEGIVYEYLGIKFCSPTIGLYFYADDYIRFCKKFSYYINQKLNFITYNESRYRNELIKRGEKNIIIGVLDDIEIMFLHYKSQKEAKVKWEKRCKRINYNCLIFKFCEQNLCTSEHVREFDSLPYENKFCFTTKNYNDLKSIIWLKCDRHKDEVEKDYYVGHRYFSIIDYINAIDSRYRKKPLKVLQFGMTYNLGGIESYLINYYRKIDKKNIQFDFINIYDKKLCFCSEIENMGGKIFNVANYYNHPIKFLIESIKIIKENNYQIIHCNMNSAAMIYPLLAAKIGKARIIITHAHNSSNDKGILKSMLHCFNRMFIPLLSNYYFACSNEAGKWFFNKKITNSVNYKIIYNAIDYNIFKFNKNYRLQIRKELQIAEDCFVVGHIGRFNKQKNHEFLISIFAEIAKKRENSKLVLVGCGPLSDKIKNQVKRLNIEKKVIFLGQRNDINKIYNAFDLFVLPSIYEGLPLVGVEAQINGLKCFFSNKITKELSISDCSDFIQLDRGLWIDKICKVDSGRVTRFNNFSKFDINSNAKYLENFYLEEYRYNEKCERR